MQKHRVFPSSFNFIEHIPQNYHIRTVQTQSWWNTVVHVIIRC